MGFFELFGIGIGLSMDAFSVSISKGICMRKASVKDALTLGLYFGFFQFFMPVIGYFLGSQFYSLISFFDHWISFFLLLIIGSHFIKDAFQEEEFNSLIDFQTMILFSIATSIDAFAVGISFSLFRIPILPVCFMIGLITFFFSFVGVFIGAYFGNKYSKYSQVLGGVLLILIGIKILVEHLYFL